LLSLPAEKDFTRIFFSGILLFEVQRSGTEKGKIPLRRRYQPALLRSLTRPSGRISSRSDFIPKGFHPPAKADFIIA